MFFSNIVTRLKGSVCLCAPEPNQTGTDVCSQESKGFLVEYMAPILESQVSCDSKTWLPDGFQGLNCVGANH